MKGKTLKYIIFMATASIAAVLLIQFGLLRSTFNLTDRQFTESVTVALKEVAWQLMLETGHDETSFDELMPVEIISSSCFLVNVDEVIDSESLKIHLVEELRKHEIHSDVEFALYDPVEKRMNETTRISSGSEEEPSDYVFPTNEDYINYFGVHFPDRRSFFTGRLSIWYVFTGLLVVVILFFGYTLSVIIKQRQLSEIQKSFINNLTHELKTPISSIALSASVINDKKILDSPRRLFRYAQIIEDQNKRLSKNVEKVLNLASLEKNKIHLNLTKIDVEDFFKELTSSFKQTEIGQKASFRLQVAGSVTYVLADQFHFTNLVLNIFENAVKYCDKRPLIHIDITKEKDYISISFADNGIGIPKDQRKKIFKKFYRIPTGNVHNVKGFGLGLDYVQKIVHAHNWKIKVEENPEGGSIFILLIKTNRS